MKSVPKWKWRWKHPTGHVGEGTSDFLAVVHSSHGSTCRTGKNQDGVKMRGPSEVIQLKAEWQILLVCENCYCGEISASNNQLVKQKRMECWEKKQSRKGLAKTTHTLDFVRTQISKRRQKTNSSRKSSYTYLLTFNSVSCAGILVLRNSLLSYE